MPESGAAPAKDGPNEFMLAVLKVLRATDQPLSAPDLEDHDMVGGDHRKRAIRYALQRLSAQKLIERCDPPTGKSFGRRPPAFYRAASTNAPVPYSKRGVHLASVESVSIDQTPSAGTEAVDKRDCQQVGFVNSSEGDDPGASHGAKAVDKQDLLTKGFVNSSPSAGTDLAVDTPSHGHRVDDPEARFAAAWDEWD
jgi:hypothetical protein